MNDNRRGDEHKKWIKKQKSRGNGTVLSIWREEEGNDNRTGKYKAC
jgi:hypothetical protein